jgi:hypothetical protein
LNPFQKRVPSRSFGGTTLDAGREIIAAGSDFWGRVFPRGVAALERVDLGEIDAGVTFPCAGNRERFARGDRFIPERIASQESAYAKQLQNRQFSGP